MRFEVKVDDALQRIEITACGELDADIFDKIIEAVMKAHRATGYVTVLEDLSDATIGKITNEMVQRIVESATQLNDILAGGKLAIILATVLDYGVGRIWLAYSEEHLTFVSHLFYSVDEANLWLSASSP